MYRCDRRTIGGSQCQHRAGHDGTHALNGVFSSESGYSISYEWTDASECENADRMNVTAGT